MNIERERDFSAQEDKKNDTIALEFVLQFRKSKKPLYGLVLLPLPLPLALGVTISGESGA